MGNYKKENITSIGELVAHKGGRNLWVVFKGNHMPVMVHIDDKEFKAVRGNKELMKDAAIKKLNDSK